MPLPAGGSPWLTISIAAPPSRSAAARWPPPRFPHRHPPPPPPWEALATKIGPRLQPIAAPLADCVAAGGQGAEALFKTLKNPFAISDTPGLTQTLLWQDAWQSAPASRVVLAESPGDVAAAVAFAAQHRVPIVTRGGCHSYFGNSNAGQKAGASLMIWTQAMRQVAPHEGFVPAGAPIGTASEPAVSIGTGALWGDVYRQCMAEKGIYVQGGGCLTVGVAGFTLGGGFGSLSKRYGTGAGNLIEAEVVTADGKIRIANRWQEPELFFALRGGGGGTFGIATRLTVRAHPMPQTICGMNFAVSAADEASWRALVGATIDHYANHLCNPHWGESIRFGRGRRMAVGMVGQNRTKAELDADWAPLLAWIKSQAGLRLEAEPFALSVPAPMFWNPKVLLAHPGIVLPDDRPGADPDHVFWASNLDEAGQQIYAYKSRWMPQRLLEPSNRPRLVDAIVAGSRHWSFAFHFNKGLAGCDATAIAHARETAMNAEACDAFALLICAATDEPAWPGIPGHAPDRTEGARQAAAVETAFAPLAAISPGAGCYLSESDWFDPDWQRDHWGTNYPRLLAAKRRYDPLGLFTGHHCVGT